MITRLSSFPSRHSRKMGYVDGKTDADLLLEEDDGVEDRERLMVLKVEFAME